MAKRKVILKVENSTSMVNLMEKLGQLDVDLEADARPGSVAVTMHGTEEKIKSVVVKLRELEASIKTKS
jgi:hypothetical protein